MPDQFQLSSKLAFQVRLKSELHSNIISFCSGIFGEQLSSQIFDIIVDDVVFQAISSQIN